MKSLIIIFTLLLVGCSNINKNHNISYYSNGNIKSDVVNKNGIKNGPIFNYFEDGSLAVEGYFKNDMRDKKWYFYDKTTKKLSAVENYKNGKLEGEQSYYYPSGKLRLQGKYKDNIRVGFWQLYDEAGNLTMQNIFLDGEALVSVAIFQKNGKLSSSGLTKDGVREGVWQYYDKDGKLLYDVEYNSGIRDGEWRAYDEVGNIIVIGYYNQGKILGLD